MQKLENNVYIPVYKYRVFIIIIYRDIELVTRSKMGDNYFVGATIGKSKVINLKLVNVNFKFHVHTFSFVLLIVTQRIFVAQCSYFAQRYLCILGCMYWSQLT